MGLEKAHRGLAFYGAGDADAECQQNYLKLLSSVNRTSLLVVDRRIVNFTSRFAYTQYLLSGISDEMDQVAEDSHGGSTPHRDRSLRPPHFVIPT